MAGFLDDVLGFDQKNSYNPWLAQIAINNANAAAAAQAAAEQQAAGNTAAQQQAGTAVAAAGTPAAGSSFDASPYRSIVDAGFSQFTPEWYANQYQAAYSPYKSGVEGQYGGAKDLLTAGLAKKGQQNSSLGRGLFQQLDALRDQEFTKGQSAAQTYQTGLEGQVKNARDTLYGSIGEGQDNASVGARTKAATDPIFGSKAPASSLGADVFGSLVEPYANASSPAGPAMSFGADKGGATLNLAGGGGPGASTQVVGQKKKKF